MNTLEYNWNTKNVPKIVPPNDITNKVIILKHTKGHYINDKYKLRKISYCNIQYIK